MLTIYKASAGSGKTFQLVAEYLGLLMKKPYNYRHILAVTFTNKATNEMKSRILKQLYLLAQGEDSRYLETLQNKCNLQEEAIRQKSKQVLRNILHDYHRFSISTIDSFTQRVIKAFNRELGISPNFTLELDNNAILDEAVDRMLEKIDRDKKLLDWLVRFSEEKITENKNQRIEEDIKALGKELFNEKFQLFFPDSKDTGLTRENLESFKNELGKTIAIFEDTLKKQGREALQIMDSHSLEVDDFSGKQRGIGAFFVKLSNGEQPNITKTVEAAAVETEKWYTKTSNKKEIIHAVVQNQLQPLLSGILNYYSSHFVSYFSAVEVNKQLRMLGILTDLKDEIKTLLHEKGVLQLSDSNLLLSKIIGDNESPFIFEKIGSFLHYFMLDEFQDTSALQWKNFKPLIANSLSEGHNNLLVGDVKQSIYRWRNSDWNILANQVNNDFPNFVPQTKTLEKNWRSDKNIIDFNNAIIQQLKTAFEDNLFSINDEPEWLIQKEKFSNVYSDFVQEPGNISAEKKGWVKIDFLSEEEFKKESTELLIKQVKQLQDIGLKSSEIAILIRTNKDGTQIIEQFLAASKKAENSDYNLTVLSNESLFLRASNSVLFVILFIELLIDPENLITKAAILNLWQSELNPELSKKGIYFSSERQQSIPFQHEIDTEWQLETDFENEFNTQIEPILKNFRREVLLSSLDETISEICGHFRLFALENELPFLQTLIDKAGEIKLSVSNDLSGFLQWWYEKGYNTSVNVNDEVDSIRLLTVHKAKGLEFKAVLIPYLNWNVAWSGNQSPTLWCHSEQTPFDQLPLFPVKATKALEKTLFKNDYFEELANSYTDTLNLVYVAFTRAESILFIHCPYSETSGKSVNKILKESLQNMSLNEPFTSCWQENDTVFEYGAPESYQSIKKASNLELIKNYEFNNFREKVKLRWNGEEFLIHEEHGRSVKNMGKIVHEILSEIETADDIDLVCERAYIDGRIDEKEHADIRQELTKSIQNPEIKQWFDGSKKVISERNLITSDKILRPDRLLISGENAIVIDYKTGGQKLEKYNSQVKNYAKKLKETGFEKVDGFLWYITLNEVEKVIEL